MNPSNNIPITVHDLEVVPSADVASYVIDEKSTGTISYNGPKLKISNASSSTISSERSDVVLNPNKEVVNGVAKKIYDNHGKCPETNSTCPCNDFLRDQTCRAGLFVRR